MPTDEQKQERERQADRLARKYEAAAFWEKGFTACALLMSGRYEDYAKERDKWQALTGRKD
jgi:uncharacterized protein with von Willebrand factor type A (vWA) domain